MPRTDRFMKKSAHRFIQWARWAANRIQHGLGRVISHPFRSHAAWSAKAWGAVHDSSLSGGAD